MLCSNRLMLLTFPLRHPAAASGVTVAPSGQRQPCWLCQPLPLYLPGLRLHPAACDALTADSIHLVMLDHHWAVLHGLSILMSATASVTAVSLLQPAVEAVLACMFTWVLALCSCWSTCSSSCCSDFACRQQEGIMLTSATCTSSQQSMMHAHRIVLAVITLHLYVLASCSSLAACGCWFCVHKVVCLARSSCWSCRYFAFSCLSSCIAALCCCGSIYLPVAPE